MHPILAKFATAAKWYVHVDSFHYRRGNIISLWAAFEASIDRANSLAWRYSNASIGKVVPQSLRWKLETFKKIHAELLPFADLREQAAQILEDMKAIKDDRHWLAHGVLVVTKSGRGSWTLEKAEFQKDGSVEFIRRQFTEEEVSAITRRVRKLGLKIARYANAVAWKLGQEGHKDMAS